MKLLRQIWTNSRCVNFDGHTKVRPLHLVEVSDVLIYFMFYFNKFIKSYLSLGFAKLPEKLMFHYL